MSDQDLVKLVDELRELPSETEWVEFKENNANPKELGEYICALSNSAALFEKPWAYLVWGIEDEFHDVVGTKFDPQAEKKGNEELESWLHHLLKPPIDFRFLKTNIDGHQVVVLKIPAASHQPVQFGKTRYIRVGSYKKNLIDCPEKERSLWRVLLSEELAPLEPALNLDIREPPKWTQSPTIPGYTGEYRFHLFADNIGAGSAKNVSGTLRLPPGDKLNLEFGTIAQETTRERTSRFEGQDQEVRFSLTRPVHKGESALVLELILKFHKVWRDTDIANALIRWELYAEHMEPVSGEYTLPKTMQEMISSAPVAQR